MRSADSPLDSSTGATSMVQNATQSPRLTGNTSDVETAAAAAKEEAALQAKVAVEAIVKEKVEEATKDLDKEGSVIRKEFEKLHSRYEKETTALRKEEEARVQKARQVEAKAEDANQKALKAAAATEAIVLHSERMVEEAEKNVTKLRLEVDELMNKTKAEEGLRAAAEAKIAKSVAARRDAEESLASDTDAAEKLGDSMEEAKIFSAKREAEHVARVKAEKEVKNQRGEVILAQTALKGAVEVAQEAQMALTKAQSQEHNFYMSPKRPTVPPPPLTLRQILARDEHANTPAVPGSTSST